MSAAVEERAAERIGDDERCDRDYENLEAERRRLEFAGTAEERRQERERERDRQSLGQRLDRALLDLASMSTQPAAKVGRSSKSAEQDQTPTVDVEWPTASLRVIEHHVQRIERLVDGERGHGTQAPATMREEEKDRMLWTDFAGVPAAEVARVAPYLGESRLTIIRARTREAARRGVKVNPNTGEVIE